MIGVIHEPRGEDVAGLIYYLYGPGRHEEHTDPHIVTGWRHPAELEPPLRPDGTRDFRKLTGLLKQPHAAMGMYGFRRPVWHLSMRAARRDKVLSDEEWAQIARDVMNRTGLCPDGEEDDAVRWIAVRHGDDHIHVVAMLARQDRRRVRLSYERRKVRDACLAAEERYGLESTAPADRTAPRRPTRAETGKAARRGLDEPPRVTLRRHVTTAAAGAGSEQEFFALLGRAGVLTRPRYSTKNPGQITGYAVALPGDTAKDGGPVWYGGGKLAPDLSWPKLRQRWTGPGTHRARSPQRSGTRSGSTPPAPPRTPPRRYGCCPAPTRPPLPMPPGPLPTPCTWPPPRSAAASCGRPPTPTTAPPAPLTPASPPPARPGTSCAAPPGSSPRSPTSPKTRH